MKGLLADVNVQGHIPYLRRWLEKLGLLEIIESERLRFTTFPDLGLSHDLNDRALWVFCQTQQWVFWTDNRNDDGHDSLQRAIRDLWAEGCLPVLTLSNKGEFETNPKYAERVAKSVAEVLIGLTGESPYRAVARQYVPLPQYP